MTEYPLVTVITPAYNQDHYLAETIDTVLAQEYPNLEYIVLNDGSTDDTLRVMQSYAGKIILESHENMGEARTVNKGFEMANGEFVMVVNADDPVLPGLIDKQVAVMVANSNIVATYPDFCIIDETGKRIQDVQLFEYDRYDAIKNAWCIPGPGALIRRKPLEAIQGRSLKYRYNSDMDFWYRLSLHGEICRVPEVLAIRREHSEARGVALRAEVGDEIIIVIKDFFDRSDIQDDFAKLRSKALSSAYFEAGSRQLRYRDRRKYFWRAFFTAPRYWFQYRKPAKVYEIWLIPEIVRKAIDKTKMLFSSKDTNTLETKP